MKVQVVPPSPLHFNEIKSRSVTKTNDDNYYYYGNEIAKAVFSFIATDLCKQIDR